MGCGASSASALYRVGTETSEATETKKRGSKELQANVLAEKSGATEEDKAQEEALPDEERDSFAFTNPEEGTDQTANVAIESSVPKKLVRQSTGSLEQASTAAEQAAQKHANYMKRKQQRKARRQKQAQTEGNTFLPRNGFLSNVPEVNVDLPYRFAFVVIGSFAREMVEEICNCNEAQSYYSGLSSALCVEDVEEETSDHLTLTSVQEYGSTTDFSEQGSTRSLGAVLNLSRSFAETGSLAICASPRSSSIAITASPRSSPIALETGTASDECNRSLSKSNSSTKISEPGTYRCVCPVPYPWGKLNNKEGSKFAKLVFRPLVDKQKEPTFDSILEASSTAVVFALHVDVVEGSPTLDQQLQNMLRFLRARRHASREMRAKWAVVLWSRVNDDNVAISQEQWSSWMKQIEDFESVHGSMWRFDLIDVPETDKGDRLFAAFAKIASQRIYVNLNPCGECWESEASLKRALDDRGSEATEAEDAPMYSAECDD